VTGGVISKAYYDLGFANERKGNYEKALTNYSKSIKINPRNDISYVHRGLIYAMAGKYDKAVNDYEQAIQIAPNSPFAINRLSWLRSTCPDAKYRDGQRAVTDMRKLCDSTGWKDSDVLDTYAAANAEAGNFDEAIKWEGKAIEIGLADFQTKAAQGWWELYKQHKPCRDVTLKTN